MKEEHIFINNDPRKIEALLCKAANDRAVVICHPHSLMGGSMHNNVVEAIQEAFAAENYTTLRFNFRGVGGSSGAYDEGKGEQEDIHAVCKYLKNIGIKQISFAGYSFGAWVGSIIIASKDNPFEECIFISPPCNYFEFDFASLLNKIKFIICGDQDQFCSVDVIKKEARKINSPIEIIQGNDHFYMGKEKDLVKILRKYINSRNIIK
jgi:alpha/beta superfamily hydrolase